MYVYIRVKYMRIADINYRQEITDCLFQFLYRLHRRNISLTIIIIVLKFVLTLLYYSFYFFILSSLVYFFVTNNDNIFCKFNTLHAYSKYYLNILLLFSLMTREIITTQIARNYCPLNSEKELIDLHSTKKSKTENEL